MKSDRLITAHDQAHALDGADVRVRTHLWYVWTEVALEQEWLANRARARYEVLPKDAGALETEMKASLLTVAAVTHCLDALQNELLDLGGVSVETLTKWSGRRPRNFTAVYESLVETFGSERFDGSVRSRLRETYQLRNAVLHQRPESGPLVTHPTLGIETTPATARYAVERAREAVDLLVSILQVVGVERDGQSEAGGTWTRLWSSSMPVLVGQRGTKPSWGIW